jgi:predicted dehydrogenase
MAGNVELVGIYDPDGDLAKRRSAEWSCRRFGSFDELVSSSSIDAVFVLSPPRFHVDQSIRALRLGKHVLVEKPVGTSTAEVKRLEKAALESRLVCMPGHTDAYVPEFNRVTSLVTSGQLGTIRLIAMMFAIAHTEATAVHYDGALRTVLPHHAYMMHGMLGVPRSLWAGTTKPAWTTLKSIDQAWMVLDYPPHTTAMLFATMAADDNSASPWSCTVKAIGTDGSATGSWRTGYVHQKGGPVTAGYVPIQDAFARELHAFIAAIDGDGSELSSSLADAVGAATILDAADRVIRTGRRVTLPSGSPKEP